MCQPSVVLRELIAYTSCMRSRRRRRRRCSTHTLSRVRWDRRWRTLVVLGCRLWWLSPWLLGARRRGWCDPRLSPHGGCGGDRGVFESQDPVSGRGSSVGFGGFLGLRPLFSWSPCLPPTVLSYC